MCVGPIFMYSTAFTMILKMNKANGPCLFGTWKNTKLPKSQR